MNPGRKPTSFLRWSDDGIIEDGLRTFRWSVVVKNGHLRLKRRTMLHFEINRTISVLPTYFLAFSGSWCWSSWQFPDNWILTLLLVCLLSHFDIFRNESISSETGTLRQPVNFSILIWVWQWQLHKKIRSKEFGLLYRVLASTDYAPRATSPTPSP